MFGIKSPRLSRLSKSGNNFMRELLKQRNVITQSDKYSQYQKELPSLC